MKRLERQVSSAREWRDQVNAYFFRESGVPTAMAVSFTEAVMLHATAPGGAAGPARRHWWDWVRADFSASYTTIAIDCPGTGGSPSHAEWGTHRFARDVIAVLDELGVGRAHVYGTSMGGRVEWVAVDHPDRVGALVLGCTTGGGAGSVPADPDVLRPLARRTPQARH